MVMTMMGYMMCNHDGEHAAEEVPADDVDADHAEHGEAAAGGCSMHACDYLLQLQRPMCTTGT